MPSGKKHYLSQCWPRPRWPYGVTRPKWFNHDDVIKWLHSPRYWPLVRGIHRCPVNSPHKGLWRGALMFTLICARINGWVNNREAGDLRHIACSLWRHRNEETPSVQLTEWQPPQWRKVRIRASQITETRLTVHSLFHANDEENIITSNYCFWADRWIQPTQGIRGLYRGIITFIAGS